MSEYTRLRPLFTLRTTELAGRSKELRKLKKVLQDLQRTPNKTLCVYIAGDGGMGKTRLLEWIRAQFPRPRKTFCTSVLDLSNSVLRTDIDLVEQIFDDLEADLIRKKLIGRFQAYIELRDRFRRQELGAVGVDTRHQVINAFVDAWRMLAQEGYRLIVLLDTAELLRFEDDTVRQQFKALLPTASTKQWLADVVRDDNRLPGVLFAVAGRQAEAKELYSELCGLANYGVAQPSERLIQLGGLSRAGVDEYLDALASTLETENFVAQAEQLRKEFDPPLRTAFFNITGGSPIALAIALQLYIDGDSSDLLALIDAQVSRTAGSPNKTQMLLQRALVKALAEYETFGEMSLAIRYMALTRKGLTPPRFSALLDKKAPRINLDTLFNDLGKQIFVKRRPDGSFALHDKIADWVREGLYQPHDQRSVAIYKKLVMIYDQEIKMVERVIEHLNAKAELTTEDDEEDDSDAVTMTGSVDPVARENTRDFRLARRQRRNLIIDRMIYALRCDPVSGYKQYYELAEEAFNVGRMDYESQIRSEFLDWWDEEETPDNKIYINRIYAAQQGLKEDIVNADFAIRAVQREYNGASPDVPPIERFRNTMALVDRIHTAIETDVLDVPEFTRPLLHVYRDTAESQIVEAEGEIDRIRDCFVSHGHQLMKLLTDYESPEHREGIQRFLVLSALAFAYYEHGFLESNSGNHGEAIRVYTLSLKPYHELGFEINRARSLNDKAYSLAMVGDSDNAEIAIRDALNLRQKLGFSYLVGLSYNTYSIVQTMSERPLSAVRYVRHALRIFQGLNHEFGQMLAYRAFSEAYRRSAELLPGERRQRLKKLVDALGASQAASSLARRLLSPESTLLADVLDEYSCVYRDIARFCWQNPDLTEPTYADASQKADTLIKGAIAIVSKMSGARGQLVDSVINLAYLRYYQAFAGDSDKSAMLNLAESTVQEAIAHIPEIYRSLTHPQHETLIRSLTVYWAYLTKAYSLLVLIASQRLRLFSELPIESVERQTLEKDLLTKSIYTLYFPSLLYGNVRNVRRSRAVVYQALQAFSIETLEVFYQQAVPVAKSIGIPEHKQTIMKEFLENLFGLS